VITPIILPWPLQSSLEAKGADSAASAQARAGPAGTGQR
jgi:hypothetical protein